MSDTLTGYVYGKLTALEEAQERDRQQAAERERADQEAKAADQAKAQAIASKAHYDELTRQGRHEEAMLFWLRSTGAARK